MTLDSLSPEQIVAKQQQLLHAVPEADSIGNKALREKLGRGWSQDLYWAIRNRLVEHGFLQTGRGRGGSVRRGNPAEPQTNPDSGEATALPDGLQSPEKAAPDYSREWELYGPMAGVLRNQWGKAQGFDGCLVEVTAKQGSRPTGGTWTRPDITLVGHKTFPYLPGRYLEVVSFEVKPTCTTNVAAVYEALAHRRASTRAYVIAHVPDGQTADMEVTIEEIAQEAKKHGIGVIVAHDPRDFDTWEFLEDAVRVEPDPARLNEFIAQQTSPELKDQVVRWFK